MLALDFYRDFEVQFLKATKSFYQQQSAETFENLSVRNISFFIGSLLAHGIPSKPPTHVLRCNAAGGYDKHLLSEEPVRCMHACVAKDALPEPLCTLHCSVPVECSLRLRTPTALLSGPRR